MHYTKEKFRCKRGNLTIRGHVLKPQIEGRLPAAIVCHGFASSMLDTKRYAKHFAEEGYATVYFDFCGSGRGRSDGKSINMSVLTEKDDLYAVFDKVKAIDYVDSSRVTLAGCSQGGLVAALLAAEREAEVHKLVLYFPAFCIPDDARAGELLGSKFDPENIPKKLRVTIVKIGAKYLLDAQSLGPYKEACSFSKPVLICHGTNDKVVDYSYAQKAAGEYPDAKLITIEHGDHGFIFGGFKEAMNATSDFMKSSE